MREIRLMRLQQGVELTLFCGSHLAPKFLKVVANSKKLVAILKKDKIKKLQVAISTHKNSESKQKFNLQACGNNNVCTPKDNERKRFEHTVLIKLHGEMMGRVH